MNKKFLVLTFLNLSLFLTFILFFYNGLIEQKLLMPLVVFSVIITSIMLYRSKLGFALVYLVYLSLTHLSIPVIELIDETPLFLKLGNDNWYFTSFKERATAIAAIGIISFNLSVSLMNAITQRKRNSSLIFENKGEQLLHLLGRIFVVMFFCYLLFLFVTGNLPLFANYSAYFNALANLSFYPVALFLYSIGMVLIFSNTSRNHLLLDLVIISLPALMLISSGNRGEIFYPLAAGLGVLIYRGLRIRVTLALALLCTFFILIPFVQQNRTIGFENAEQMNFEMDISDPFIEMGYQLRPYFYTYGWLESGEEFGKGASYFVPIQRLAARVIPFLPRPEYEGQPFYFRERLPNMGYSVISEAYYNFSVLGVIVMMALFGVLLSVLGDVSQNYYTLSFAAGLNAILINNIRNAFSFVPGQVVSILILLILAYLLQKALEKNKESKSLYEKSHQF